jgi:hypothetical protein
VKAVCGGSMDEKIRTWATGATPAGSSTVASVRPAATWSRGTSTREPRVASTSIIDRVCTTI